MNLKNENWKKAYNKLAEDYFDLQQELEDVKKDHETALEDKDYYASKSCCGQTTFVADSNGVIDRPLAGTYHITLIVTNDIKENA